MQKVKIADDRRLETLPRFFGVIPGLDYENYVYATLTGLSEGKYQGGYWDFYELVPEDCDPGVGFLMQYDSDKRLTLTNPSTGASAEVSAEAASIIVNLYASSHLSFKYADGRAGDVMARNYDRLYALTAEHDEAGKIFMIID